MNEDKGQTGSRIPWGKMYPCAHMLEQPVIEDTGLKFCDRLRLEEIKVFRSDNRRCQICARCLFNLKLSAQRRPSWTQKISPHVCGRSMWSHFGAYSAIYALGPCPGFTARNFSMWTANTQEPWHFVFHGNISAVMIFPSLQPSIGPPGLSSINWFLLLLLGPWSRMKR